MHLFQIITPGLITLQTKKKHITLLPIQLDIYMENQQLSEHICEAHEKRCGGPGFFEQMPSRKSTMPRFD